MESPHKVIKFEAEKELREDYHTTMNAYLDRFEQEQVGGRAPGWAGCRSVAVVRQSCKPAPTRHLPAHSEFHCRQLLQARAKQAKEALGKQGESRSGLLERLIGVHRENRCGVNESSK